MKDGGKLPPFHFKEGVENGSFDTESEIASREFHFKEGVENG